MANRENSLVLAASAVLALLISSVTMPGCAAGQTQAPVVNASPTEAPAAASASPTEDYLIGAGDVLQIFVWRQDDLSVTIPVRPDGKITTPLIEDLVAVGKTTTQLGRELEQALSEYVRSPQVNVIVQQFVGLTGAQIRVTGQAQRPQAVPYRDRMTLLDVVIAVGGLTEFAAGNRTRVVRTVDGKRQEIKVRLDDLVNRGDTERDMLMRPGDIVIIPERVF